MEEEEFYSLARKHLNSLGYSSFQLKSREEETRHGIEALIDLNSFAIAVTYDPEWRSLFDGSREKHIENRGINEEAYGSSEDVLRTVIYHEHGHWRFCPYDIVHLAGILNGVARGLKEKGLDESSVRELVPSKANEFEDIIVNSCLALENPKTKKGRATRYLAELLIGGQDAGKSFATFVDIQMKLYHPSASEMVKMYAEDYSEIKKIVDSVLTEFGRELHIEKDLVNGKLTRREKERLIEYLMSPENWEELAYHYARLTSDLGPVPNISETPFNTAIWGEDSDLEKRRQLIQTALKKGYDPSLYMDPFEVFQEEHRHHGRILHNFFIESGSGTDLNLPFAWLTTTPTSIPTNVRWSKTRSDFMNGEEVVFGRRNTPLMNLPSAKDPVGSLADLLLVCDNSGSMRSSYLLLVDTVFSIFESLRAEGKLHLLEYGLIQFSDASNTSWSGWSKGNTTQIERELYQTLKTGSFGGRTALPKSVLEKAYKPNIVAICVTDGEIHTPEETLQGFSKYENIVWFQISQRGKLQKVPARLAEDKNAIVHKVSSIEELPGALIPLAKSIYARKR